MVTPVLNAIANNRISNLLETALKLSTNCYLILVVEERPQYSPAV